MRTSFTLLLLAVAAGAHAWETRIPGPTALFDRGDDVVVDASRNIYVGGQVTTTTNSDGSAAATTGIVVASVGPDASPRWQRIIEGPGPSQYTTAGALILDGAGGLVVAGTVGVTGSPGDPLTAGTYVARLSAADGSELWHRSLSVLEPGRSSADGGFVGTAAIAPGGDIVAAGGVYEPSTQGDAVVVRLDPSDGSLRWHTRIDGPAHRSDFIQAVAITPSGDVAVAGGLNQVAQNTTGGGFWVSLLSGADGSEQWRYTFDGSADGAFDGAVALAIDAAGSVHATGWVIGPTRDIFTVKLSGATGAELWRSRVNGTNPTPWDFATAIALDAAGDVVIGGSVEKLGTSNDAIVLKLSGIDGTELWRTERAGLVVASDSVFSLALDPTTGDVLAGGIIIDSCTPEHCNDTDPFLWRLDGATGAVEWFRLVGGGNGEGYLQALALDGAGHVVAVGQEGDDGAPGFQDDIDLLIVKLDAASGGDCGDEVAAPGVEQCDDGGTSAGDGCAAGCTIEPTTTSGNAAAGPVSSGDVSTPASAADPLKSAVTPPAGTTAGSITITESAAQAPSDPGFQTIGATIVIDAVGIVPAPTPANPLVFVFVLDRSLLPQDQDEMTIAITKDGVPVPNCGGTLPCVNVRERLADGDVRFEILTLTGSDWAFAADALCDRTPASTCRAPIARLKSRLLIKRGTTPEKSKLSWKWTKGAATALDDFGDPTDDTAYALCVYDARRGIPTLIARVAADPGQGWLPKGTKGFQKKDSEGVTDGLRKLALGAGPDGKAKITLAAKGAGTPANALPVTTPLTAQLRNDVGVCWGATYASPKKNDATQVNAKGE